MDEKEQIKQRINIIDFINAYLPLKKAGRNFKALCPFHQEKTPSFIVSPERQMWHCFGACNEGGDIFTFLMKTENLEFGEALRILAKRAGVKLAYKDFDSAKTKLKQTIYQINHLASEFYHYLLLNHQAGKKALDYLHSRGINKKSIKAFKLGFAPNLWEAALKFLAKKGYSYEEIEKSGLIIKQSGRHYDRFRGRIIFTLKDHRENIVGFSGRTLEPEKKEAKYINTPETLVYIKGNLLYGLDITSKNIKEKNEVIIVEGEFDVISSFQQGVANIVAIKGSALTEGQINLIKRFTENIVLSLDADLAGDQAARKGIELADQAGLNITVVELLAGKDPDECIQKGIGLWEKSIKKALPIYDYFINSSLKRNRGQSAFEKKKIGDEVIPLFAKITNPIVQSHYIKKLSEILDVSQEAIIMAIKKSQVRHGKKTIELAVVAKKPRQELLEEQFLAFILQNKDPKSLISKFEFPTSVDEIKETFIIPAVKKILLLLFKFLKESKRTTFKIKEFLALLSPELVPKLDQAYLLDLEEILNNEKKFSRFFQQTIKELKKLSLCRKLKSLTTKIREENEEAEIKKLNQDYKLILKGLKEVEKTFSINQI